MLNISNRNPRLITQAISFAAGIGLLIAGSLTFGHGITEADKKVILDGGYLLYAWLGAKHMLTGYDHLLFIFGVIFFLTGFRDIIKYITAFTLGHSITLILATIYQISANYYIIDAAIALSVCYKGFENLDGFKKYFDRSSPNLLFVVFGFGLIHGFGLSARLQQLPLVDEGLILRILSFNVGVEAGQVVALAGILFFIASWRRSHWFPSFAVISNRGLIIAGLLLFFLQLHGAGHSMNLKMFAFASDKGGMAETAGMATSVQSKSLEDAIFSYNQAFQNRDVNALWDIFADDMILIERGRQDISREEALMKHLGPDLQAFKQMTAQFSDMHILETQNMAIVTRHFMVKAILPNRYFSTQGRETQGWAIRDGQWKIFHIHWSFPSN